MTEILPRTGKAMDHQWRRDHDLHDSFGPAPTGYLPSHDPYRASVGQLKQEVARLQHLLAISESRHADHLRHVRQLADNHIRQATAHLRQRIAQLEERAESANDSRPEPNAALKKLAKQQKQQIQDRDAEIDQLKTQVESLKEELANVASVAASEQQHAATQFRSTLKRQLDLRSQSDELVTDLEQQLESAESEILLWKTTHDQATSLCEWHDREHAKRTRAAEKSESEFQRYKLIASGEFLRYEEEIQSQNAIIELLRTDHEAVELTCDDLNQLAQRRQCELDELQTELQSLEESFADQLQTAVSNETELCEQLEAEITRAENLEEQNKHLENTVLELQLAQADFDAALFAKDQELHATEKLANEAQRQLETLRREHTALGGRTDQLRNELREAIEANRELTERASVSEQRLAGAESKVDEVERQIREMRSAARAAEANALLQANETQQQYESERERLEDEVSQLTQQLESLQNQDSQVTQHRQELQQTISDLQARTEMANSENDRLQGTIDQLSQQLAEQRELAHRSADSAESQQLAIEELELREKEAAGNASILRSELEYGRKQLAEYADQVAKLQSQLADRDAESVRLRSERDTEVVEGRKTDESAALSHANQLLKRRVNELERVNETLRGAHGRNVTALQRQLTAATQELQSVSQRYQYVNSELVRSRQEIAQLESEISQLATFENPRAEAERLSRKLAECLQSHAQEKEILNRRIVQLLSTEIANRAA